MMPRVITSAIISFSMRLGQRLTVKDWDQMREPWGGGGERHYKLLVLSIDSANDEQQ